MLGMQHAHFYSRDSNASSPKGAKNPWGSVGIPDGAAGLTEHIEKLLLFRQLKPDIQRRLVHVDELRRNFGLQKFLDGIEFNQTG